jgi:hypothetical protein
MLPFFNPEKIYFIRIPRPLSAYSSLARKEKKMLDWKGIAKK